MKLDLEKKKDVESSQGKVRGKASAISSPVKPQASWFGGPDHLREIHIEIPVN